ncbi:MAG TPA: asparagine synthase (glutamine-hydrolyzing) [Desulfobulbaceae bacterium]|nr:asparagine synthase (glutamine-hydrolyzing) [Desulfobulbaceae bacterium]
MCGIAAIFAYHPDAPPVDRDELLRMREQMKSRGPDGSGLWLSEDRRIGMAHRRLSIIDLSEAGAQPMTDPETGNIIVFNGEIYNYRELRSDLENQGFRFRSHSDTEVLLHLYAAKGPAMVNDLRGMYAFAIYTPGSSMGTAQNSPSLFLARDPFGIKPLYIHDDGKTLRLASQVKALLAGGGIVPEVEPAGHAGFFLWGHVPEPYSLYKNILAFEPGTTLCIKGQGKRQTTEFFSIRDELARASHAVLRCRPEDARQTLREALLDTVRAHLIADVPVGIFLSSGLDSTTLAALASELGADLRTVTLGFEEFRGTPDDEVPLAETVARHYRAKHQTVWVTKDEFRTHYDALIQAMDQPTIDGVNTWFVSLAARRAGLKVALSGLGGDELFGGYPSFSQIPRSVRALGWASGLPQLGRTARSLAAPFLSRLTSPKYASLLEYGGTHGGAYLLRRTLHMPWELPGMMDADLAMEGLHKLGTEECLRQTTEGINGDYQAVSALESTWYMRNQLLRDADWASMAHSLEIRVPLVDLKLLRETATLAGKFGMPGKQAMALAPSTPLLGVIMDRAKTGFTIPVRQWLAGQNTLGERGLRGWARNIYHAMGN